MLLDDADQCVADGAGQTGKAHNKAHNVRAGDQEHDDSGGLAGIQQDLRQVLDLDAAVNNDGQEQGVGNSHGRRLRCGEDAGHNTADNDNDQQQAGDRIHKVLEEYRSRNLTGSGIVVLLCDDICHHHAGQCPHQAGDVAGHDHTHHRAASQHRIDDQDAGRRNDQTGRCGSDVDGSSELFNRSLPSPPWGSERRR